MLLDVGAVLGRTSVYRLATEGGALNEEELEPLCAVAGIDPSSPPRCVLASFDLSAACVSTAWARALGSKCRAAAVITSLAPQAEWFGSPMDLYLVTDLEMAESVLPASIPPDNIVPVGGISLCGSFAAGAREFPEPVRERLGLDPDAFTLLLVTSGLSPDSAVSALTSLVKWGNRSDKPTQILVDMAEDLEMRRALLPVAEAPAADVRIFGKVDNAPDWWACADAVALNPVEYLVSRALGYGRPLLVLQPDGPTARRLASELERRGVAESVPSPDRLSEVLSNMVAPDRWEQFVSRARTHGRSGAVPRVASALVQLLRGIPNG
jgi:hypothetical protein